MNKVLDEALRPWQETVAQLEEQLERQRTSQLQAVEAAIESMRLPTLEVMDAIKSINVPPVSILNHATPQLELLKVINAKLDQFIAATTKLREAIEK